jgi:hypothetical protein
MTVSFLLYYGIDYAFFVAGIGALASELTDRLLNTITL